MLYLTNVTGHFPLACLKYGILCAKDRVFINSGTFLQIEKQNFPVPSLNRVSKKVILRAI
jgi:hypothetical protein